MSQFKKTYRRKNFMHRLWVLLLPFLIISSAWAAETVTIEEVVVTASRLAEPLEEATSDVIVITEEEIKEANVEFVTDILRQVSDLNLVQSGGKGKSATVLLRGGSSKQTLVMIDGVKVKSTTTGSFDFSGIQVDDIERIEIVKGPQSTIYGSEAMAGVINIITKKGKGRLKTDFSFEAGSFNTYKPVLTISGGEKGFDYRITASYLKTDGISVAKDGSEEDGYKNVSVSGKFGFKVAENSELEFTGRYYYARNELDFGTTSPDDPNYVQHGNHYVLSGKGKFYPTDNWEHILTVSTVKDILKTRDADAAASSWYNSDITTRMDTVDWQHNFYLSDTEIVTVGVEYRNEKGENEGTFDKAVDNKAVYLNTKFKKENVTFNIGLRYDDHETFGSKTTYRLGAVQDIKEANARFRVSYATGFRAPTFNELFWPGYGNSALKPEESTSWEVGIDQDLSNRTSVSITYFEQEYENLIQTDPATWTAANIAEAEVKGIETDATFKLTNAFNLKASYTYLDTEDKSTGQRLTRRPIDKFNLTARFADKNSSVLAEFIYVGKRYDSSAGRDLAPYSLVNLSGSYKMKRNLTLFARVENLFDEDYEEAGGYGTPGISFYGGIKTAF
jgi:vitamin B12 transporter